MRDRLLGRPTRRPRPRRRRRRRARPRGALARAVRRRRRSSCPTSSARGASWPRDRSLAGRPQPAARRLAATPTSRCATSPSTRSPSRWTAASRVDPHGGAADLAARRLRAVGPRSFADDPLRAVRLVRLAAELGLDGRRRRPRELARAQAPRAARRRARSASSPSSSGSSPADGVVGLAARSWTSSALTAAILPELSALHGVEQNRYHHPDVHDHTLEVLEQTLALQADPGAVLGERARRRAARRCSPSRSPTTSTAASALRLGALLHDAAKPATRGAARRRHADASRATTAQGAELARDVLDAAARERAAAGARRGARAPPPAPRLPRPRAPAVAARRCTATSARCRAGRGRRHAAVGRRSPGDARPQGGGGDRQAPRARARGAARRRCAWRAAGAAASRSCAATCWPRALALDAGPRARPAARGDRRGALRRRGQHRATRRSRSPSGCCARPTASLRADAPPIPTASSARSSPASCPRRSSPRTSARSPSWTSSPRRRGHVLVIPRAHCRDIHEIDPEDLAAVARQRAADRRAGAASELGADGREPPELQRRRGLADGLSLPHARHPALRGRPAAAAVDARRRATWTTSRAAGARLAGE